MTQEKKSNHFNQFSQSYGSLKLTCQSIPKFPQISCFIHFYYYFTEFNYSYAWFPPWASCYIHMLNTRTMERSPLTFYHCAEGKWKAEKPEKWWNSNRPQCVRSGKDVQISIKKLLNHLSFVKKVMTKWLTNIFTSLVDQIALSALYFFPRRFSSFLRFLRFLAAKAISSPKSDLVG